MYPHAVDRLRIFQFLIRYARTHGTTIGGGTKVLQKSLAKRAGVSQSTASRLENLVAENGTIQPLAARETVIGLLTHGMQLPQGRIDALLWLWDGEPLDENELRRYLGGYHQGARTRTYTADDLRGSILNMLDEALVSSINPYDARVTIRFSMDEKARLAEQKEMLQWELQPGFRISATRFPSSLSCPQEPFAARELTPHSITTEEGKKAFQAIYQQRQAAFIRNLNEYGERCMHSRHDLRRYLTEDDAHDSSLAFRRRHFEHWIELLDKYPRYEFAFLDSQPQMELGIKSNIVAIVRGTPRTGRSGVTLWGIRHIFWHDILSILVLLLNFERQWLKIPQSDRTKSQVVEALRRLLRETVPM
jgi:hypothetical protein